MKSSEKTLDNSLEISSKKLIVKTPKKVVTKEVSLASGKPSSRIFSEINANVMKTERRSKIESIKKILAEGGIAEYLKTHTCEDIIDGMGKEVLMLKEMVSSKI